MVNIRTLKKKICLLGDEAVGKTSLVNRFVYNEFTDEYISTLGAKISKKHIQLNILNNTKDPIGIYLTLSIWDLLGQKDESAVRLRNIYYNGTNGAIIICDITRKETFQNLTQWIRSLHNASKNVSIVILGNKIDRVHEAEVYYRDLERFSQEQNIPVFITSAKDNNNVEKAFNKLSELMLEQSMINN